MACVRVEHTGAWTGLTRTRARGGGWCAAQKKYWACTAIFGSWVKRSGFSALVEWDDDAKNLSAVYTAEGMALLPSPEMIMDFLLQARGRSDTIRVCDECARVVPTSSARRVCRW